MTPITRASLDYQELLDVCTKRIRDIPLRVKFRSLIPTADDDTYHYEVHGKTQTFHALKTIIQDGVFHHGITSAEINSVYKTKLAKGPGRIFYERIMRSAVSGRCPYCSWRRVSTLDHYLPKAHYSKYGLAPVNLVPCCKDCNHAKGESLLDTADREFFHPYFENLENEIWLGAQLSEVTPPYLTFTVSQPHDWSQIKYSRVKFTFEELGIDFLYASHAAEELASMRARLKRLYASGQHLAVNGYLAGERDESEGIRLNSWKSAMFRALANSPWYCAGGFAF